MGYTYADEIAGAQADIKEFGASVFIRRGGIDIPTFALMDITITNLVFDGNLVRMTDRFCYVPADPAYGIITADDQFVIKMTGKAYRIVTAKPTGPGDIPVIWLIQARL